MSWNLSPVQKRISLAALLFAASLLGAVIYFWNVFEIVPKDASESIFIDSPEVYTRERLINERLAEESWLLKEIARIDDYEHEISTITSEQGGVRFWIGQRPKAEERGKNSASTGPQAAADTKVSDPDTVVPSTPAKAPFANPIQDQASPTTEEAATGISGATPGEVAPPASDSATPKHGRPTSNSAQSRDPTESEVGITFDQSFKLRSAYRSLVRQRLIENKLDDRHDLSGNSLYILKFDTTVMAVPALQRQARTEVEVRGPNKLPVIASNSPPDERIELKEARDAYFNEIYSRWITNLQQRINRLASSQVELLLRGDITWPDIEPVYNLIGLPPENSTDLIRKCLEIGESARCISKIWKDYPVVFDRLSSQMVIKIVADTIGVPLSDVVSLRLPSSAKDAYGNDIAVESYLLQLGGDSRIVDISVNNRLNSMDKPEVSIARYVVFFQSFEHDCPLAREINWPSTGAPVNGLDTFITEGAEGGLPDTIKLFQEEVEPRLSAIKGTFKSLHWSVTDYSGLSLSDVRCKVDKRGLLEIGLNRFSSRLAKSSTFSYSVLPKENPIAVKAEIRREIGATDDGKVYGYDLKNVKERESIALQPLLSTYGEVRTSADAESFTPVVGWTISPWAAYGESTSTLSSVSESVLAIVSVPAWWPELYLNVKTSWIDKFGREVPGVAPTQFGYPVELPRNQEMLDTLAFDQSRRGPVISKIVASDGGTGCAARSLLIVGQRLWRNTTVTLGGVRASDISVLPDMSAVIASFNERSNDKLSGELIVWTSEGYDTVRSETPIEIPGVLSSC